MQRRILVAGEADEADHSLLLRAIERLDHAALREMALRVTPVCDLVYLPEVEVVRPEPTQRLLEHAHRRLRVAPVRADLGHEEDLLPPAVGERFPHARLAQAVVVLPRVVHERDARVHGAMQQRGRLALGADPAEMVSAESERGHGLAGATKGSTGNLGGVGAGWGSHGA